MKKVKINNEWFKIDKIDWKEFNDAGFIKDNKIIESSYDSILEYYYELFVGELK